jgi:hypothetical protein
MNEMGEREADHDAGSSSDSEEDAEKKVFPDRASL